MIFTIHFAPPSDFVSKKDWILSTYKIKILKGHRSPTGEEILLPRAYLAFDHELVVEPWAVTVLGITICVIRTKECE